MKFGMNLLLWTGELNDEMLPVLESLKSMGWDGVELPMFDPQQDFTEWNQKLNELGLERSGVTIRGVEDIQSALIRQSARKASKITSVAWTNVQHVAFTRCSVPTIRRSATLAGLAPPRTSGNGASRA